MKSGGKNIVRSGSKINIEASASASTSKASNSSNSGGNIYTRKPMSQIFKTRDGSQTTKLNTSTYSNNGLNTSMNTSMTTSNSNLPPKYKR